MTEKRYFSIDYDEEYYIFDSTKISKEEVLEKAEYSYDVFGDSLMENEVLDLLNENEQLKKENKELKEIIENLTNREQVWETKAKQRITELEKENYILSVTVQRNEGYIERLTTKGKWTNSCD